MKKIAIFGAGGFGQEAYCIWTEMLKAQKENFEFIGFFDDGKKKGDSNRYGTIAGNIDDLNSYPERLEVCLALGTPCTRHSVAMSVTNPNISYPNIIHPSLKQLEPDSISIGNGNIISMNVIFSNKIQIGDFNVFNTRTTIGHDVLVGSYNVFSPNVQVSGGVQIGNLNLLGFNSGILQGKKVGSENVLGAGSVLLRHISDGHTYIGNPARKFIFNKKKD